MNFSTTYYWKVVAVNAHGPSVDSEVFSFSTEVDISIYEFPWLEDFGTVSSDWPPQDWTQRRGQYPNPRYVTSPQWVRDDWLNGPSGNNAAQIRIYGSSRYGWLITPLIAIPADGYEMKFDLCLTKHNYAEPITNLNAQRDDRFIVIVSDNPEMSNPTIVREWNNTGSEYVFNAIPHTGESITIDLTGYSGRKYFAFYGHSTASSGVNAGDNDLMIDNVMIRQTPSMPIFSYTPTEIDFGLLTQGAVSEPVGIIISNIGGASLDLSAADLSFSGTDAAMFAYDMGSLPIALTAGQSATLPITITPALEGDLSAALSISFAGEIYEVALSAHGLPAGAVFIGNGTEDAKMPVSIGNGYTYTQTIYPQSAINLVNQRIEKVQYFWSGTSAAVNSGGWTIYMGHTSAAEFTSSSGWVPFSELTQVFSGNLDIPATAGWIEVPLHIPFLYNNVDNLVIAVDENTPNQDYYSGYFHNTSDPLRVSLRNYNNTLNPDPVAPPAGTLVRAYPNVLIQFNEIPVGPPDPVTVILPEDGATDLSSDGFDLSWSPAFTGGYPDSYAVLMSQNENNLNTDYYWDGITATSFDPTQAATDPLTYNYSETWYWTVIAMNGDGEALQGEVFSFTIMDDPRILSLPYSQNFDSVTEPDMPPAWTGYTNSTVSYANVETYAAPTFAQSPPNSVKMYGGDDLDADLRLITPQILVPVNSIKLSFYSRISGAPGTVLVGTVDTPEGTFTQLGSFDLTTTKTQYVFSFAGYTGTDQYICFKHAMTSSNKTIYLDDIYMEELFANDLALTAFSGDSYGFVGDELSYGVSVHNNGSAEQDSYNIELLNMPDQTVLASFTIATPLASDATAEHTLSWSPALANTYKVQARVVLAGDTNPANDDSDPMIVGVFVADSYTPFIGDPLVSSSSNYMPFNMYYKNNVSETIYLAHEMQMTSGTINAICYHNNFSQDLTKPVKIWMAHSSEDVNTAWLPFESYTLVFDGDVHFPIGVNAIVIPLQTSFQYTGGNLAVRTNRVHVDDYFNSNNNFYYTLDNSYPNRSRSFSSDGEVINPANPGGGTQNSQIPNTAFIVDPYTALPALDAPVLQITSSGSNLRLSWEAVENALNYVIYGSNDPHNWADATEMSTTALYYELSTVSAMNFYKVVARSYNHQTREIGQVFNPAAVIGFDNSAVRALPVVPNHDNKN